MQKISGLMFAVSGFIIWMGITTAEIFYPSYSVRNNFISNLGSTRPPHSVIYEPSATIFDSAMIIAGILIIAAGLMLAKKQKDQVLIVAILLMGIGTAGVGFFPAYTGMIHDLVAALSFIAGGIAAILFARISSSPFKYFSAFIGILSLSFLFLGEFVSIAVVPIFGNGGVERWVAFPITIWLICFGGYLMGKKDLSSRT